MENKGDNIGLFIPGLLVLLSIVGLNLFDEPKLKSNRPLTPKLPDQSFSDQQIPARLWQDPFAALQAYSGSPAPSATSLPSTPPSPSQDGATTPGHMRSQIEERLERGRQVAVLAVMLPGQPYAEAAEGRTRIRYAVLSALGAGGQVPADAAHIGQYRPSEPGSFAKGVAYEWFSAAQPTAPSSILVLWLNDDAFGSRPLDALAKLLDPILPDSLTLSDRLRVRVLGPLSSNGLQEMLREVNTPPHTNLEALCLRTHDLTILSPNATAADEDLRAGAGIAGRASVEEIIGKVVPFRRTIADDSYLGKALAEELAQRGLDKGERHGMASWLARNASKVVPPWTDEAPQGDGRVKTHVILLAEWDTAYGRSLPLSVARALSDKVKQVREKDVRAAPPGRFPAIDHLADLNTHPWIHYVSYMRGLDGDVPTPTAAPPGKTPDDKGDKKGAERAADPASRAEGPEQLDYVRRLARDLIALERDLKAANNRDSIFAIGILGNDVHDKLLILQALRPLLPGAVFFTTDLDARLVDPAQGEWTRGLIVSSAFALRHVLPEADHDPVKERRCQWPIPPFRSSYQTSYFVATRSALDGIDGDSTPPECRAAAQRGSGDAQLFELGRTGPVGLLKPANFTAGGRGWPKVLVVSATLVVLLVTMYRRDWIRVLMRTLLAFMARRPIGTALMVIAGSVAIWWNWDDLTLLVCPFRDGQPCSEPFSLTEGISIWPPLYLQTLALVLSVTFWAYVFLRVRANALALERKYFTDHAETAAPSEPQEGGLADVALRELKGYANAIAGLLNRASGGLRRAIDRLKPTGSRSRRRRRGAAQEAPPAEQDAAMIWHVYRQRTTIPRRVLRVLPLAFLFFVLVTVLFRATGSSPSNPVRGLDIAELYTAVRVWDLLTMALLAFGVLDAALQCRQFIKDLARAAVAEVPLVWPAAVVRRIQDEDQVDLNGPEHLKHLDAWVALRVIAEHADAVARLVIYPLIVLAILVVARMSWFDTVTFPASVLIAYLIFGFYILLAAWSMQRAANAAKQAIRGYYARCRAAERNRPETDRRALSQYAQLEQKVAGLQKGAFKPIAQMPLVRAALLPFGALGIGLLDLLN